MRKLMSLIVLITVTTSCGVSGINRVKEPEISVTPKYELGSVTLPKDTLEKLKDTRVSAKFSEVPLGIVLKAICQEKKLSCNFSNFKSSIPITLEFEGSLYSLLKELEKTTGYRFSYENDILSIIPTSVAEEKEKEWERRRLKTSGPKVTLNLSGVPLFALFNEINSQTGFTIIPDQNVDLKRKVFASTKNLSLDKALKSVLYPLGYSFEIDGEKKEVYVSALETRVFKIPVVPKTVDFSFKAGEGTEGSSSSSSTSSSGSSSQAGKTVEIKSDFWGDLETSIKNIVSKKGTYFINKTARLVTVTDTPDNIRKVEKVINSLIQRVTEQVAFRIAVYEVTYSDEYKSGIDWSGIFAKHKLSFKSLGDASSYLLSVEGTANTFGYLVGLLSRFGKVKTVYDNYIRTKSGETVAVVPAETFRYLERIETQSQADTGLVTRTPVFGELSLGIQVYVTPMKRNDREVEYEIALTNRYLKSLREYTFDGSTYVEPERIGKTQVSLDTVIPKGTLEVITGIKQYRYEGDENGVPLLMDIPVAGEVFKSRSRDVKLSEYVIAIYTY